MDKKQLEKYRKKLLEKRHELVVEFKKNVNYQKESAADEGTQDRSWRILITTIMFTMAWISLCGNG